ncbi:MAG: amino acid adenylation domain-containing protein [Aristaeellaceae bacterium]
MKANMLEYLEGTARRVPERVAFYDDQDRLTYAALLDKARRIGSCLAEAAAPRTPVALLIDSRSIRNIAAIFATLYAGCAYAPLDITMPPERLRLLLSLMQPSAVLADARGEKALEDSGFSCPVVSYERAAEGEVSEDALARIRREARGEDPMSLLYTSGSTGTPKGSVQTQDSYIRWMEATIAMYSLTEDAVFANQSPFFYANSILDIFPPMALGAKVYLLPSGVLTFPKKLIACLNEHRISLLCMTPSSFVSVVNADVLTPDAVPGLKWGIMSGEAMPWLPLKAWMDATPNADWWHFYGSTEMFSVAVGKVDKAHQAGDRLPVGKPFPHVHILFVDENGDELPAGEPGEMLVSSPWVAGGYHLDPARTAQAWVTDPLRRGTQERFYRCGDVGYLRPDGQLMVLGRRDNQIKHRGYRMEIGEVEAALRSLPGWQEGCVLFDQAQDTLWCFFTGSLDEKGIKAGLKESLARYMLPDRYIHLDEMPHTATMKTDRQKLRQMML